MENNKKWELSAVDWADYCAVYENDTERYAVDDVIGSFHIGELCFDICPPTEVLPKLSYVAYKGGEDTGYGYSAADALATGKYHSKNDVPADELYPYARLGDGTFCDSCIWMTYEDFKEYAEKEFSKAIKTASLEADASKPLHIF